MRKHDMTEIQQSDSAKTAKTILAQKEMFETVRHLLPWCLVFAANVGITIYTVVNANVLKIIATGVFFTFSLIFLFLMKRGE